MRVRLLAGMVSAALLASGCGEISGPDPHFDVVVEGRLERGGHVQLQLLRDGEVVSAGQVTWSADPAAAVEFLPDGRARLADIGPVTFRADVGSRTWSRGIAVEPPPRLVFDLVLDGIRDIYRVDLDGANLQRLTFDGREDAEPSVAGGVVIFASMRAGTWSLYSLPLEGGAAAPLTGTSAAERNPALSPDGSRLLFTREIGGVPKLVLRDMAAGTETRLTTGFGHAGTLEVRPAWSRSGEQIAFVSTALGGAAIFRLIPGTATPEVLVAGGAGNFDPSWNADGSRLAFASDRSGDNELYVFDVASGATTRLTFRDGSDGQPAWLPDGRIVFTSWRDGTPRLQWIDPLGTGEIHDIPTGGGAARNAAPAGR
jgi:Tol biopolymer transport system component